MQEAQRQPEVTMDQRPAQPPPSSLHSYLWLAMLALGYIGVYLCRKNLAVAVPMLRGAFGSTHEQIGVIASVSTVSYAAGKFLFGPLIDRLGGRFCFFVSLTLVALFCAAGGLAPGIPMLVWIYSGNRLAGSAAWGSMMKMTPEWFSARNLAFASALLSLSFVFGGVCATLLAMQIARWSGDNWRAVMSGPSIVLACLVLLSWFVLPRRAGAPARNQTVARKGPFDWGQLRILLGIRQMWVVCGLSFALTLMRETFNTWTVDFFATEAPQISKRMAAFMSTPFDAFGALGIVSLGWAFGRMDRAQRNRSLCAILAVLSVLLYLLPHLSRGRAWLPVLMVALIGFLAYGPYSLLAGVLSVEIRGKEHVGMVAGIVDGVGYLAGILAGQQFGRLVDVGGYALGFHRLAYLTVASAVLCLFLYPQNAQTAPPNPQPT